MKKFSFGLDTVLNYKGQVLDNLKSEHSIIIERMHAKEEALHEIQRQIESCVEAFSLRKLQGASISEYQSHDQYLYYLRKKKETAEHELLIVQRQEKAKREEVISAKKDTKSIENLKDKKLERYRKEELKVNEIFIEEFVSNLRSSVRRG